MSQTCQMRTSPQEYRNATRQGTCALLGYAGCSIVDAAKTKSVMAEGYSIADFVCRVSTKTYFGPLDPAPALHWPATLLSADDLS
jgi:hypothetical protein